MRRKKISSVSYLTIDEKISNVFDGLVEYIRHFKSIVYDEMILEIKQMLIDVLKNREKILDFQQIGFKFANAEVIFNEALLIFEFIRKNLNEKEFERLLEEIENQMVLGYLKYEASLLKGKLDFIEKNIISKDVHNLFADPLRTHIDYFKSLLEIILKDDTSTTILHQPCPFSIWLNEKAKDYADNELILKDIKRMHQYFHSLIDIAEDYRNSRKFKDLYFTILNLENAIIWIENSFLYMNTQLMKMEMSIDPLTKALNRRSFETIMQKLLEISKITNAPISLAVADLDHFKKVNDTYGHLAGDEALKHFVSIVKKILRKSDYVFRLGGEEFVILLPSTGLKDAIKIVEKIRKEIESHPLHYDGKEIKLTASFGLVEADIDKYINEIIKEADEKLYKAKELGRNRVVF
jgi:diguanylate cyclase (GGDEF)-like protein